MTDLNYSSALALSALIKSGELSIPELMHSTLDRIDDVNGVVNAIVSLGDRDALMAQAQAAQSAPRKGWLHGIPIAIKDLANAKGFFTTMGSPLFAGEVAPKDDIVVERLKNCGCYCYWKNQYARVWFGQPHIH